MDFGVFVELGPDCNGLVHISRLSHNFVEDPHQHVQSGDLMNVWVVGIDEKKKRVILTAIPPGTEQERRSDADRVPAREEGNQRGPGPRGDSRGQRGDRAASGDSRQGGERGRGDQRRSGGDNRSRNDRQQGGRRDGGRGRGDSGPRQHTARVQAPKPVVPITEAMQQGKEPLRSFSDLMQFMKKDKADTPIVAEPNTSVLGNDTDSSDPGNHASTSVSDSVESAASGDETRGPVA
jgi:protein Tex